MVLVFTLTKQFNLLRIWSEIDLIITIYFNRLVQDLKSMCHPLNLNLLVNRVVMGSSEQVSMQRLSAILWKLANFSYIKTHSNYFSFVDHMVSLTVGQLCHCHPKAGTDNTEPMNIAVF